MSIRVSKMVSQQEEYVEQLRELQERWPQIAKDNILNLLKRFNGDTHEVYTAIKREDWQLKMFFRSGFYVSF